MHSYLFKMVQKKDFLERRSVIATFGILALLGGVYFTLGEGFSNRPTGNYALTGAAASINLISLIGALLILCSAILIVYAIVKKE